MSIVSSTVTAEAAQKDGRFWVHELHTDNVALKYVFDYLANAGTDFNSILAARALTLADQILSSEVNVNISLVKQFGALAVPTFNYSTKVQQAPTLREAYRTMTQTEAVFTGEFLSGFTDAQLSAAFNIPINQVATLRTNKLTPAVNTAVEIRATTGT